MKKLVVYLFLVVIVFYSQNIVAQDIPTEIEFYKPSEIPVQIEKTSSFLVKEKSGVLSSSMISSAQQMIDNFDDTYTSLDAISDSTTLNNFNSVQLKNLNRRWIILQEQMGSSLKSISERTQILEKVEVQFQKLLTSWKKTREKDTEKSIPNNLLNSIEELEKEILTVLEILQKESNSLLSIQSGFANKNISIETKLLNLKELVSSKHRAAFDRNSYPLWEISSDTTTSSPILKQASELINTYKTSIKNFYEFYQTKIPLGFLVFLMFLGFTYTLKFYSNKIEDDSDTIQKALILLKRPFSVSFLLFLFFISLTTEAATTFEGFRKILMLIPLLIILLKIIDPRLKSGLYVFMFLFLVKELKVNTGSDTIIERLLLLSLTLLTFLSILWAKRSQIFKNLLINSKTILIRNFAFKTSIIIISLVLLLNILGYVMLANILVNGFYNSLYATILILTANILFGALLLLMLKTKPMQKLKVVALHSDSIISTSSKIIKLLLWVFWIVIVLSAFNIYEMTFTAIESFLVAKLGVGSISISLGDILLFIFTIWVSVQISKFLQFILEADILPQFKLPRGVPGAILSMTKYSMITIGLLLAFMSVGFDFSKFAILIGALGVGIGFGLQNLVNNFISGIILIFERPIQTGDIIKVGDLTGAVKKIGIRASIVRTFEGAEIIVPNGNLISAELTNWTFSDRFRRMDIAVGVEYGSPVEKVKELLLDSAKEIDGVLDRPAPIVLFKNFGDSSLDFTLRSWTKDFDNWLVIESNLRFEINKLFEENNIVIPFPQTDIHIKEIVEKNK